MEKKDQRLPSLTSGKDMICEVVGGQIGFCDTRREREGWEGVRTCHAEDQR